MSSDEKIVSAIRIYRVFIDIKSMDIISIFFLISKIFFPPNSEKNTFHLYMTIIVVMRRYFHIFLF